MSRFQPKDNAEMVRDPAGFWVPYTGSVVSRDEYDKVKKELDLLKELLHCRGPVWEALYTAMKTIAAKAEEAKAEEAEDDYD